jgi:hypothetical protein
MQEGVWRVHLLKVAEPPAHNKGINVSVVGKKGGKYTWPVMKSDKRWKKNRKQIINKKRPSKRYHERKAALYKAEKERGAYIIVEPNLRRIFSVVFAYVLAKPTGYNKHKGER